MCNIIEALNWRSAIKVFDKNKKVSKEDLEEVIESFRLTSSSFWLQPWKLLVIENGEIKNSLVEHSWSQSQISDCSHLLVLCRKIEIDYNYIDNYLNSMAKIRWVNIEKLAWYEQRVKWFFANMDKESIKNWAINQVYIALWNLLTVLALKKIDSCAVGWFIPEKYDEVLALKEKWLASVVVLPIWYRSKEDKYSKQKKVRFDREDVVEVI